MSNGHAGGVSQTRPWATCTCRGPDLCAEQGFDSTLAFANHVWSTESRRAARESFAFTHISADTTNSTLGSHRDDPREIRLTWHLGGPMISLEMQTVSHREFPHSTRGGGDSALHNKHSGMGTKKWWSLRSAPQLANPSHIQFRG